MTAKTEGAARGRKAGLAGRLMGAGRGPGRGAAEPGGPGGAGEGCPGGGAAGVAGGVRAGSVAGSGGAAAGAGQEPGAGPGADPAWADAGVAVHVLPGGGAADGGRPGHHSCARDCGFSCAGTRTWPISARSLPPAGGWCLTSTISTRPCRARSSGMSSGWRPAWPWPGGRTGSQPRTAARSSWRGSRGTARRCGSSPASRSWRSGTRTWTSRTRSPSSSRS